MITKTKNTEDSSKLLILDFPTRSILDVGTQQHEGILVHEPLPQLTTSGLYAASNDAITAATTYYFDKPRFYQVILEVKIPSSPKPIYRSAKFVFIEEVVI